MAFSVALGINHFNLLGVIYGPVMICIGYAVYDFIKQDKHDEDDDKNN